MAKGRRRSRKKSRRAHISCPRKGKTYAGILADTVTRCNKAKTRRQCDKAIQTATNRMYHNKRLLMCGPVKRGKRTGAGRRGRHVGGPLVN